MKTYPQRSIPFRFVLVRASCSNSWTVTPLSSTNRMQFNHITSDTSQGPWSESAVERWLVVR